MRATSFMDTSYCQAASPPNYEGSRASLLVFLTGRAAGKAGRSFPSLAIGAINKNRPVTHRWWIVPQDQQGANEPISSARDSALARFSLMSLNGVACASASFRPCGLRYRLNELGSLTPENFSLDGPTHTISCKARNTKNGRPACQPIHASLAELLRPWHAGRIPGRPVFAFYDYEMPQAICVDLKAAGVENLWEFDFHCLRHSYRDGAGQEWSERESLPGAGPSLRFQADAQSLLSSDRPRSLPRTRGLAHTLPTNAVQTGLTGTDGQASISSPGWPRTDPGGQAGRVFHPDDNLVA
jgi:hypothetical protein